MNPPPFPVPPLRTERRSAVRALTLPVLGIPVRFETDAPAVMRAIESAFGAWRGADADEGWDDRTPVRVRILLAPGDGEGKGPPPLRQRWRGGRLWVRAGESRALADIPRRTAVARVAPALLRHPEHLHRGVLEALTLWLLTALDRQPLHAAAVERDGAVLLLAGASGVGKSTLVYAAMRAGMRVLAEDAVFLQDGPVPRVWGMPGTVHLLPDAVRWFPELADAPPAVRANGKTKLAVSVHAAGAAGPLRGAERVGICLLARGPLPTLESLSPHAVQAALTARLEPGFHRFAHTIGAPVRRLAERGGWRLTLPATPHAAVPLLHRLFDAL